MNSLTRVVLAAMLLAVLSHSQPPTNDRPGLMVSVNGRQVGTATSLNLNSQNGTVWTCSMSGARMNCDVGVDTATILSKASDQAGTHRLARGSSGGSGVAYAAQMNPVMTGYTLGQILMFVPDVNCRSNPTLSIGGLGPMALDKIYAGGLVPLAAGDCIAGIPYLIRAHGNPPDAWVLSPQ